MSELVIAMIAVFVFPLIYGYVLGRNHVDPVLNPGYYSDPVNKNG